jgi:mannose-6-phosphate isomerase-like protein (cupin superfamily)
MTGNGELIVVAPGEGRDVQRVNGERTTIKVGRAGTRGAYAVRENSGRPRSADVPLHVHRDAEEAFYVLSGRLAVLAGDRRITAEAGSFVLIPRGLVHAIANPSNQPVRWFTLISRRAVGVDRGRGRAAAGKRWPSGRRGAGRGPPALRIGDRRAAAVVVVSGRIGTGPTRPGRARSARGGRGWDALRSANLDLAQAC